jgi:hypothetical protein
MVYDMRNIANSLVILLIAAMLSGCLSAGELKGYEGAELPDTELAIIKQSESIIKSIIKVNLDESLSDVYISQGYKYKNPINLSPGTYKILAKYHAHKIRTVGFSETVNLHPGHIYRVRIDDCYSTDSLFRDCPAYTAIVWLEDQTTGKVIAGCNSWPEEEEWWAQTWVWTIYRRCLADEEHAALKRTSSIYAQRALEGDADAQYEHGYRLRAMDNEIAESWRWFCLAAHQGHAKARYALGNSYRWGRGPVELDPERAYLWYTLAGDTKYAPSYKHQVATTMTPEKLADAERMVAEWQPNPAECDRVVRTDN